MSDHTLKFYGEELTLLKAEVVRMGGLVESQTASALRAVVTRDRSLAEGVLERDREIDDLQVEIERQSIRLIALRQPLAQDLRRAVGALKLSLALERAGDYAKNIAKRALVVADAPISPLSSSIDHMGRLVIARLSGALDAYGAGDVNAAAAVWSRDEDVDEHYNSLFRNLLTHMISDPRTIGPCAQLLFVAKNLERIGDYATTVAEVVRYEVEGEAVAGPRPKWEGVPQGPAVSESAS